MPKHGAPMSADQQAHHTTAMRSPLRRIIGAVEAGTWSTGEPYHRFLLECGHASEITSPETAQLFAQRGLRKRCLVCGQASHTPRGAQGSPPHTRKTTLAEEPPHAP